MVIAGHRFHQLLIERHGGAVDRCAVATRPWRAGRHGLKSRAEVAQSAGKERFTTSSEGVPSLVEN